MSGLRRFISIIYVIASLGVCALLVLPWTEVWPSVEPTVHAYQDQVVLGVEILGGIALAGLIVIFLRAISSPKNADAIIVGNIDKDTITVTRSAIASQATHIVEDDGTCICKGVRVRAKKHGHIKVFLRVAPIQTVDVIQKSVELHERLSDGLAVLCGNEVERIDIEFLESKNYLDVTANANGEVEVRIGEPTEEVN